MVGDLDGDRPVVTVEVDLHVVLVAARRAVHDRVRQGLTDRHGEFEERSSLEAADLGEGTTCRRALGSS